MIRVLIVDDHEIVRRGLKEIFADAFPDVEIGEASNSKCALESLLKREWGPGLGGRQYTGPQRAGGAGGREAVAARNACACFERLSRRGICHPLP